MPEQVVVLSGELRSLGPVETMTQKRDGKSSELAFRRVLLIQDLPEGGCTTIEGRVWRTNSGTWPAKLAELEKQVRKVVTLVARQSSEKSIGCSFRV